nr:hypothetical protein [Xanthomonas oryzae]
MLFAVVQRFLRRFAEEDAYRAAALALDPDFMGLGGQTDPGQGQAGQQRRISSRRLLGRARRTKTAPLWLLGMMRNTINGDQWVNAALRQFSNRRDHACR